MGLLKKLAGLVVEFPDEEKQRQQAAKSAEDDVAATIERIRLDLEQGKTTSFDEPAAPSKAADTIPAAAPVSEPAKTRAPERATGDDGPADAVIQLPSILGIEQVYAKAGIAGETDFDINKVEEMLADPEIADLSIELKARMVRMTLKNMGRDLQDILSDAGQRDQALENYQFYLERRAAEVESQVGELNAAIQAEIDEFIERRTAAIEANREKLRRVQQAVGDFKRSKQAEEQRLFDIAAPFVAQGENPVEVDE